MKRGFILLSLSLFFACRLHAQNDSAQARIGVKADTGKTLPVFIVRAYEQQQLSILKLPAAVNVIDAADLGAYNNNSILQAVNSAPGVRMEERSPGSFRFGIRGSSLESPFGVRNIKVYYNGIPYTDPSGNTYLNQLGFYNIQSLEIIKGPGSSLYGSGTGGVLLINSMPQLWQQGATVNYTGGSYGLSNVEGEIRIGDTGIKSVVRYQHLQSNEYRQQSAMRNDVISWDAVMKHGAKGELSAHFFYGDLYYQTPGGLTVGEYDAGPEHARPGAGNNPGAIQAKAAIYQKTFLSGFSYKQQLTSKWSNNTTVYGDYSSQINPNLRNYSRTSEPNFGSRTVFAYETTIGKSLLQWTTGGELQQELAQDKTYNNVNGNPQALQSDQEINNGQVMGFTQLFWQVSNWIFTGSASINQLHVALTTVSNSLPVEQDKTYSNQVAPRLAILNRLADNLSVYAIVEKGFSPPTIDELAPTGSAANLGLYPEQGWNYEVGFRGYILKQRLYFDMNAFYFRLQNTIVQRRDSGGGDFYTNSGAVTESGAEVYFKYRLSEKTKLINSFAWLSYAGSSFHYDKFMQLGNDYSGKALPGTPANAISAGFSFCSAIGIYLDVSYYYGDRIPLNDANTAYSNPYNLLGSKAGYRKKTKRYSFNFFVGANNILNQKYSLGNDINAVNGRYYNAAAPLNYYAGLSVSYLK